MSENFSSSSYFFSVKRKRNKKKFHFKVMLVLFKKKQVFYFIFRSSHRRCSVKKTFLEILQNSQENTYTRVSFWIKYLRSATLLKKRLWPRRFLMEFAEFLRTPFSQNTTGRLLLHFKVMLVFIKKDQVDI